MSASNNFQVHFASLHLQLILALRSRRFTTRLKLGIVGKIYGSTCAECTAQNKDHFLFVPGCCNRSRRSVSQTEQFPCRTAH
jgi:hypothetical protein